MDATWERLGYAYFSRSGARAGLAHDAETSHLPNNGLAAYYLKYLADGRAWAIRLSPRAECRFVEHAALVPLDLEN